MMNGGTAVTSAPVGGRYSTVTESDHTDGVQNSPSPNVPSPVHGPADFGWEPWGGAAAYIQTCPAPALNSRKCTRIPFASDERMVNCHTCVPLASVCTPP